MPKSRFVGRKRRRRHGRSARCGRSSGGSSPAIARSSVVLPHPDGPRKQTNSPSTISSEMSVEGGEAAELFGETGSGGMRVVRRRSARAPRARAAGRAWGRARWRPTYTDPRRLPATSSAPICAVALLPLPEDARAVHRRPLEVVLGHVREHVGGQVLDRLDMFGIADHRVAFVVELHRLLAHRPVDERLSRLEVLGALDDRGRLHVPARALLTGRRCRSARPASSCRAARNSNETPSAYSPCAGHRARLGAGVRVDADVLVEGVHVLPALGLAEDLKPARHVEEPGARGRRVRHHDLALVDGLGEVLPRGRLGQVPLLRPRPY